MDASPTPAPEPQRRREPLPQLRASDADRQAVQDLLSEAFADGRLSKDEFDERSHDLWQLRTLNDISSLTTDLVHPDDTQRPLPVPRAAATASGLPARNVVTGNGGEASTLALMGGSVRAGHWTCAPQHTAFALMGGIQIDLREADFTAGHTTITCLAIMGGIEILVPDDLDVRSSGIGIMGGFVSNPLEDSPSTTRAGAPVVVLNGLALVGGVDIKRVPRQGEPQRGWEPPRQLEDDNDDRPSDRARFRNRDR